MKRTKKCAECGGTEIYTARVGAGGGYAPDLLPGAQQWWRSGKLDVYVCGSCGHYQFFVPEDYLNRVKQSKKFRRHT